VEPILQALANPTLAYALFVVGCTAVMMESFHPGALIPGITGGACLLIALVGLVMLPVNWLSLLLVAVGLALFALDVQITAHGALTVVGLVAFAAGSLTLFGLPGGPATIAVPLPLVLLVMLIGVTVCTLMVRAAVHMRHLPSINGPQRLLGHTGTVASAFAPTGTVQVDGELWSARLCGGSASGPGAGEAAALVRDAGWRRSPTPTDQTGTAVVPGHVVRIVGRRGLILEVEPVISAGDRAARTA
jgi:membrane-bound serine protease (ClpP class)